MTAIEDPNRDLLVTSHQTLTKHQTYRSSGAEEEITPFSIDIPPRWGSSRFLPTDAVSTDATLQRSEMFIE